MVATPHRVGDWKLVDSGRDFLAWHRDLGGRGTNKRNAAVWVEDSATGEGFIAWAHVEPEGGPTVHIVDNGEEVFRAEAIERAMDWMRRNPRWPEHRAGTGGMSGGWL